MSIDLPEKPTVLRLYNKFLAFYESRRLITACVRKSNKTHNFFHSFIPIGLPHVYTGCNRRNGPDFGRVFLILNYTEKPQNTYIQS